MIRIVAGFLIGAFVGTLGIAVGQFSDHQRERGLYFEQQQLNEMRESNRLERQKQNEYKLNPC